MADDSQLYVGGQFIGGCNIVRKINASGDLQRLIGPNNGTATLTFPRKLAPWKTKNRGKVRHCEYVHAGFSKHKDCQCVMAALLYLWRCRIMYRLREKSRRTACRGTSSQLLK